MGADTDGNKWAIYAIFVGSSAKLGEPRAVMEILVKAARGAENKAFVVCC